MNFQLVDAVMGQKDGNYPKKVSMKCLADSPDPIRWSKDNPPKPSQQVWITDGPGQRRRVKIVGNFPDLTKVSLGQLLDFELWAYVADFDKKKYYMGFCNVPDDRQGPATEPTKDTRYDYKPHNAQPDPPKDDSPDWNVINRGKCRFGFYQAVIQSGMTPVVLAGDKSTLTAIGSLCILFSKDNYIIFIKILGFVMFYFCGLMGYFNIARCLL